MREINLTKSLSICTILLMVFCTVSTGKVIYVNGNANGDNNGSSWEGAYNYLQDALADANDSEKPVEIRVAQGIYKPDQGADIIPGDREATFHLIDGVTIIGGYAGADSSDPNTRDIIGYETILSGDLDGNDVGVNDPQELEQEPTRGENSVHVLNGSGTEPNAVLDGFTVTAGYAYGLFYDHSGGGMYNRSSNPILKNCIFKENYAYFGGGGIHNDWDSNPIFTDCVFTKNSAGRGGGIHNDNKSDPNLINCSFKGNSAENEGGGIYNNYSDPNLTDCTFSNNSGTGIYNTGGNPILTNCTFSGNSGTGMYNKYGNSIITNCTFSGNSGTGMYNEYSNSTLTNCTFSSNSRGGMRNLGMAPTLTDCTFISNSAPEYGGGMYNADSNPTLINCIFSGNITEIAGGGMYNDDSNPILTNCTFSDNSAPLGAGIYNEESNPILDNCAFNYNFAWIEWSDLGTFCEGGGMYNYDSDPNLTNCIFSENKSLGKGGGIHYSENCQPVLTNCTFAQNSAENGNALACDSWLLPSPSNIKLINCILHNGGNEIWNNDGSTIDISYCNIQGGWPGEGNIDVDPLFVETGYWDPNGTPEYPNDDFEVGGDYHLKSQAGRWEPNSDSWVFDDVTSPCIDAGDPNSPVGDEPEPNGGRINMGAYGGTAEASKSSFN